MNPINAFFKETQTYCRHLDQKGTSVSPLVEGMTWPTCLATALLVRQKSFFKTFAKQCYSLTVKHRITICNLHFAICPVLSHLRFAVQHAFWIKFAILPARQAKQGAQAGHLKKASAKQPNSVWAKPSPTSLKMTKCVLFVGVGDVCFFLTMRCFPILNDAMFWMMFFNF